MVSDLRQPNPPDTSATRRKGVLGLFPLAGQVGAVFLRQGFVDGFSMLLSLNPKPIIDSLRHIGR